MPHIETSLTSFGRFVAAQSSTRITKVRAAKKMAQTPSDEFRAVDYWLALRRASIDALIAGGDKSILDAVSRSTTDRKKVENYTAGVGGLKQWIGRKDISATKPQRRVWTSGDLEVTVNPEIALTFNGQGPYMTKLHFNAERVSKHLLNPLLRLIELTYPRSTAAILNVQEAKLHTGPTTRPGDLDVLLASEASAFVQIWREL